MGRKEDNIARATEVMHTRERIRNLAIAAHIDHGKTTLSDNLIAGAGMMSEDLAGKSRVLDFDEQESARGITINAASASMVHAIQEEVDGNLVWEDTEKTKPKTNDYLINLIDTPGHVDFGGDVTRAMRAVDGCIILACAVEGTMPQTETVVRQALKEKVRPVLFINKVDRLINELQIDGPEMMQRFEKIILKVNKLIQTFAPEEVAKDYVLASRLDGASSLRILRYSVFPNILERIIQQATLAQSAAILDIAALGFLGLGAPIPLPEWGAMLSNGIDLFYIAPWTVYFPGLAILFAVVATNLVGEGMRHALKVGRGN